MLAHVSFKSLEKDRPHFVLIKQASVLQRSGKSISSDTSRVGWIFWGGTFQIENVCPVWIL